MSEPISYQTPLPPGRNLRFWEAPDIVRISRDSVSQIALWREALAPTVLILFCICGSAEVMWWLWRRVPAPVVLVAGITALAAGLVALALVPALRDAMQNAGVVTEIAVTRETLFWKKRNLWGTREYLWPLETVRLVDVDRFNRILKVRRDSGTPLGAFAYHSMEELERAAATLNQAIARFRAR